MTKEVTDPAPSDASYAGFVEEAWPRHLRYATLLVGDRQRAEELLQDCLVKLYVRWRKVGRGDPHAYLRRMLVNGRVSWWRRARRETLTAQTPDRADPHAGPDGARRDLRDALMTLSHRQRTVIVLRYYLDLTERQVADELGCSVSTVKSQHSRAMAKLRALIPHPRESTLEAVR
ncbi:SigE family RNA polymerase sigma factor [Micromonospora sp. NPDC002717]|uniref:SigE family RNA polymerase sigma factor n=1 Tax=Micromonospora sp. NPDC002717 TaxID=3154424 RepID=UPI0033168887